MRAVEARGIDTGELTPKPVPSDCGQLLQAFWELRRSAGNNGFGPNAISYVDIAAWQSIYGVRLEPLEVDLIFHMDRAALAEANKQQT